MACLHEALITCWHRFWSLFCWEMVRLDGQSSLKSSFHEAFGQVLDQLNEEKARQQDEMVKLHIDLRTQQAPATFQACFGGAQVP